MLVLQEIEHPQAAVNRRTTSNVNTYNTLMYRQNNVELEADGYEPVLRNRTWDCSIAFGGVYGARDATASC